MSDGPAGAERGSTHQFCPWELFDEAWYLATHMRRRRSGEPSDPLAHYTELGAAAGFGPNPYFDEAWYVARYEDVRADLYHGRFASGFAHYRAVGHRTHDPHWLFREAPYRARRGDLTDESLAANGLLNGYHHYLIAGQNEHMSGSVFFDPEVFAEATGIVDQPFSNLVRRPELFAAKLSRYFDEDWYLAMYEDAAEQIAEGRYRSALHHYLGNPTRARFHGSAEFDEMFYRERYADVAALIAEGTLRVGYEHFLDLGRFDDRRPSPWFDPDYYRCQPGVAEDMVAGKALTAFDHYLAIGRARGLAAVLPVYARPVAETAGSEAAGKDIFARMAHVLAASALASPGGDPPVAFAAFEDGVTPEISVVIAAFNQFDLTMQTLLSLSGNTGVTFEVILVDNGSRDETRRIEAHVPGLRVVRNAENLGFLRATNQGIAAACGRFVLLLNNDVVLAQAALRRAASRLASDPGIGAVGGKIVRSHGVLQEAGCMVFRDGNALGYGRDGDPAAPEYNFVRDVDYCSGVFLMLPRAVLMEMGGLDPAYAPAYYEETDLCARLWQRDLRVVYDPSVVVIHLEYGTSRSPDAPRAQMRRNRDVFVSRHRAWLATKLAPDVGLAHHGRITAPPAGRRRRVLVIEDTIPYRHLGSGFVRTADTVDSLVALGWDVTVLPMNRVVAPPPSLRGSFAETVELMWDRDAESAAPFLVERETLYDVVWVCRAHNLRRLARITGGDWGPLRHAHVVLDTEALACNRDAVLAALEGRPFDPVDAAKREMAFASMARDIIAVNAAECEQLRGLGFTAVHMLGHAIAPRPSLRRFDERADILALGSLYGEHTPNFDGLDWFIEQVWPIVSEALGGVRLLVAGFVADGLDAAGLLAGPGVVHLGHVPDVAALYDQARVFLAPTRFAAGIPYKVHEASAHGLPVMATDLLAAQLGWRDGKDLAARPTDDAQAFAAALIALYTDPVRWKRLRNGALARIAAECSVAAYTATIAGILDAQTG